MNPLDLTGPEFLRFYVQCGVVVLLAGWGMRLLLERDAPLIVPRWSRGNHPSETQAYHIAWLRAGPKAVVDALLTRLVAGEQIELEAEVVRVRDRVGQGLAPIERRALGSLADGLDVVPAAGHLKAAIGPGVDDIERELVDGGAAWAGSRRAALRALPVLASAVMALLGLAKLFVALSRGRTNVEFLLLLIALLTVGPAWLLRAPRATPEGRRFLVWLRESHGALLELVARRGKASPGEAGLATAIFGLRDDRGPMYSLQRAFKASRQKASNGDGLAFASSCGSSSCGSSGCGGGGCGGGGCGGCGG